MENFFKLKEHGTNVKTEILAGITTFMTMAYILIVNPEILGVTGMDTGGVFTATAISAAIATLIMAFYAKYPFALAPGMGLNAFFAFSVVLGMGKSWQFALTAVLIEGIVFIILSFFNAREAIFNSIPRNLKDAVSVGIGLFIAFIGLEGSKIVVQGYGIPLELGDLTTAGPITAIAGILFTGILLVKNIKGALLIGIIFTTLLGIPMGVTILPETFTGFISLPPSISQVAFQFVGFEEIFSFEMLVVVFTFLFVDIFDTVGTLAGVASKADMLDDEGKLPRVKKALMADAVGTISGACLGTSTVTTFVESASGVAEGGRTGLTSLTTACMFIISLFLAPLFLIVPTEATAPALVLVGLFMMSPITRINFNDFTEAIPAFLTIIMMPLSYSIAEGIVFGMVSYVVLKSLTGKAREISPTMWVMSLLFIIKIVLI